MRLRVLRCACGKVHCCAHLWQSSVCKCGRRLYPQVRTEGR